MNPYEPLIKKVKSLVGIYTKILNPGASDAIISEFLKTVPVEVPQDFIDFYKVCNGAKEDETVDIQGMGFSSLESVIRTKNMFDEILDEKEKEKTFFYWHKDWLPFADDSSYDTLAIDTTGVITGRKGCVLQRSKDLFEEDAMSIVATDFKTFIKDWVKRVEEGQVYEHSEHAKDTKNELVEAGEYYYEPIAKASFKKTKNKAAKK